MHLIRLIRIYSEIVELFPPEYGVQMSLQENSAMLEAKFRTNSLKSYSDWVKSNDLKPDESSIFLTSQALDIHQLKTFRLLAEWSEDEHILEFCAGPLVPSSYNPHFFVLNMFDLPLAASSETTEKRDELIGKLFYRFIFDKIIGYTICRRRNGIEILSNWRVY